MEQIKEKELSTIAKIISKKTIHITIKGDLNAQFMVNKAQCIYSRKNGTFLISDNNNYLIVQTSFTSLMTATKNRKKIEIKQDGVNQDNQYIIIKVT